MQILIKRENKLQEYRRNPKTKLTFVSTKSISTDMSSSARLIFLASQKRSSLSSTVEELLPDFKSEKKTQELAIFQ